jgi:hypothetical protein
MEKRQLGYLLPPAAYTARNVPASCDEQYSINSLDDLRRILRSKEERENLSFLSLSACKSTSAERLARKSLRSWGISDTRSSGPRAAVKNDAAAIDAKC